MDAFLAAIIGSVYVCWNPVNKITKLWTIAESWWQYHHVIQDWSTHTTVWVICSLKISTKSTDVEHDDDSENIRTQEFSCQALFGCGYLYTVLCGAYIQNFIGLSDSLCLEVWNTDSLCDAWSLCTCKTFHKPICSPVIHNGKAWPMNLHAANTCETFVRLKTWSEIFENEFLHMMIVFVQGVSHVTI